MTRYKCLVLDHDDTVVRSTPELNYPAFADTLETLRPGVSMPFDEFMALCADPGFHDLCTDILGFSEAEMNYELDNWLTFVRRKTPSFWPGMAEIIRRQKAEGGLVFVVSHSFRENILRDYGAGCPDVVPDGVYGWELGDDRRKPSPWPLRDIMARLNLRPEDLLVVDDLKPGFQMAERCGVGFACAGWSHTVAAVRAMMRDVSPLYLETVDQLRSYLFEPSERRTASKTE